MPLEIVLPHDAPVAGKVVCFSVTGVVGGRPAVSLIDADGHAIPDSDVTITAAGEGSFKICFTYPGPPSVTIAVSTTTQKPAFNFL